MDRVLCHDVLPRPCSATISTPLHFPPHTSSDTTRSEEQQGKGREWLGFWLTQSGPVRIISGSGSEKPDYHIQ